MEESIENCVKCHEPHDDYILISCQEDENPNYCYECALEKINDQNVLIKDLLSRANKYLFKCYKCSYYMLKNKDKARDCAADGWSVYYGKMVYCNDCEERFCKHCWDNHKNHHK